MWVEVDPIHLQQALMNLASNARDAMPDGGRLVVQTALGGDTAVPQVVLSVQDTGEGIASETLTRVFEPFFTTKPEGEGSGLGLAMVHGFVAQSGGTIRVDSELGEGTTFHVELPRAAGSKPAAPGHEAPAAPAAPPGTAMATDDQVILLVEDNAAARAYMVEVLQREGLQVIETGSGREAVELAQEHGERLALLVTDVVMPEIDGVELASFLVAEHPQLRVLFVTGYSDQDLARCCETLSARATLLRKPFQPGGLVAEVRTLLGGAE